jgi:NitT/TauT family transport system ATP-binding protein
MTVALTISDLSKTFLTRRDTEVRALAGISLAIGTGEVVAILGPSGCGKSSLLRILAGLDEDWSGTIDWSLSAATDDRLRGATVFQSDSTLPWMTVEKNLRLGMSGLRLPAEVAEERIARNLGLVGLTSFRRSFPHELSGGMRQRVAIARALATDPLLLLMDEPLAALDAQTRIVMQQELIAIWRRTRSTVVYVTHDIAEAVALADRVVVLTARPGQVKAIRDRDPIALRREAAFRELEAELWTMVTEEVGTSLV